MKAIVKTESGNGPLELKDWPERFPGPDEVKLKIIAAGICGTDIHIIRGEWPCYPPVVLGHEFCGVVVEVGARVENIKPGDRLVASNPAQICGACFHCRAGNPFMCNRRISAGYMIDGAFAEYLCIRSDACHALPNTVSFREAALGEPLAVAVRAVIERSRVHAGDWVLISGPGCVGLLAMQIAKLEGARVIVSGIEKDRVRLACAQDLGADVVVDATQYDLVDLVGFHTRGEGVDLAYECSGSTKSLNLCWDAIRKEGTLVQVGIYPGAVQTDLNSVVKKELTLVGSYGYVWTSWKRSIRLWEQGKINSEALLSHEYPLSRFEEAFRAAQDGSAIKVIFNLEML
jgi:L-iditol 2-dehydrogenase